MKITKSATYLLLAGFMFRVLFVSFWFVFSLLVTCGRLSWSLSGQLLTHVRYFNFFLFFYWLPHLQHRLENVLHVGAGWVPNNVLYAKVHIAQHFTTRLYNNLSMYSCHAFITGLHLGFMQ